MSRSNTIDRATIPPILLDACALTTPEEITLEIQRQIDAIPFETLVKMASMFSAPTCWHGILGAGGRKEFQRWKTPLFIRYLSGEKLKQMQSILSNRMSDFIAFDGEE